MANKKISELDDVSLTADLATGDIIPIVDVSESKTTSTTIGTIAQYVSVSQNRGGWEYVSDKALETTSITASEDTWVKLTNDGTSSATKREFLPDGCTRIYNVDDDKIYCDQLQKKDIIWFRVTLSGKPLTNNTLVKMRVNYYNQNASGATTLNFQKNFVDQNMEDGADVSHTKEFTVPFYVGSDDTIRGYGELEVNCNTDTIITDVAMLSVVN